MTEPSLEFLAGQQARILDELRALRGEVGAVKRDMDMLIRIVVRMDNTVNALREDVTALWASERDLRERVERLEARDAHMGK